MDLKHQRNEEKKTTDYIITLNDRELHEYKEMMSGPLDQDLMLISQNLTDIISNMIVRKVLTDLEKID